MFTLDLNWKTFNVSLPKIRAWVDANLEASCLGISANSKLQIHFEQEPTELDKNALQSYWNSLDEESEEATSYMSLEEQTQAKKDSAKAKLLALGLTEVEIEAILR